MLHTWPTPERWRELRRRALLTQREVERLTGVVRLSGSTLSRLERGRHLPQTTTLRKLLGVYDRF
jgi:transcriptional regulator with XRE-family HTH domain